MDRVEHPCRLSEEDLLAECEMKRQRRSGPGGQHRNKVETAIRVRHRPTDLSAMASERRSQIENQKQAVERLRLELALSYRTPGEPLPDEELWKSRVQGGKIVVSPHHRDFPTLLADALDVLQATDWEHKAAAEQLGVSSSQLVKLLKLEPEALKQLNDRRKEQGQKPLT
ncbi:peptide chain release factor family protein [Rubinisphaera margarita]|uniref:peptide chain release factor family protein n=1 Tax=Rubinisphaera margarita TaxID=2909586 RepID=UPI001EE84BB6|nr:peptide chain release factor-like protein [Rubinisphaera margarita]MCG6157914.1 peptide chain release factor-like protein [Rubinisphaera margarita]